MKQSILVFFSVFINIVFAQNNKIQNWHFGKNSKIVFKNNNIIDTFTNQAMFGTESTSTININDTSYFYSEGINIYNRNNNIIIQGLKSEVSSTQGSIMLMHPDNDSIVFMFTNSAVSNSDCKTYYYELLILNDTLLKIKTEKLLNFYGSEKISAVNHQNGKDFWLITHDYLTNKFIKYLLKKNGLNTCTEIQEIGTNYNELNLAGAGQIKFNSNGTILASPTWYLNKIDLFKFDNLTGIISNEINLDILYNYGVEFSQNGKKLYITNRFGQLYQYDLTIWNKDSIILSEKIITNKGVKKLSALQLATNGKIYWSNYDSLYIAAIEEPNKKGDSCKLSFRSINLSNNKLKTGFPTLNQSYFYTPAINYNYEMECINNKVKFWGKDTFGANGFKWQTKKLYSVNNYLLIGSTKDISYTFTDTGKYEVRYIADNGTRKDTITKTITIYPKINKQFLGKDTTYIQGSTINKTLQAPYGMYCQIWQDTSGLSTFTAIKKGIYTCKVNNQAFCEVTDTIEIKECLSLAIPSIYKRLTDSIFCTHQEADTFIWYRNNLPYKTTYTNGGDISSLKLTDTGTYRAEAVKYGHCNRTSSTFNINKLGIKGIRIEDLGIRVFPNPSNGIVNIQSDKSYKLEVTDITGRTILQTENIKQIELPKGVYFLQFEVGEYYVIEKVVVL